MSDATAVGYLVVALSALIALFTAIYKPLNENNIQDIEFTELDPIELSQNNTILTDINTNELQTNVNE